MNRKQRGAVVLVACAGLGGLAAACRAPRAGPEAAPRSEGVVQAPAPRAVSAIRIVFCDS